MYDSDGKKLASAVWLEIINSNRKIYVLWYDTMKDKQQLNPKSLFNFQIRLKILSLELVIYILFRFDLFIIIVKHNLVHTVAGFKTHSERDRWFLVCRQSMRLSINPLKD